VTEGHQQQELQASSSETHLLLKRNHLLFLLLKKPFPQHRRFELVLSGLNGFVLGRGFPNELLQIAKVLLERHDNIVFGGLSS
jgi:hypothetical protein